MVHQVTSASEFKQVTSSGPVIVDFYATWCGPCKAIAPLIEKLEPEYADVKFAKIDIEEVSEVASEYQIQAIPTFLFFKDGKVVGTVKGADPGRVKQGLQAISS